mgnify:CR=1 FL=1
MSINKVMIAGNLTRAPELRATGSGTQILHFGVAVKGRPEAGTGLCAQMRREDQVPGSEKH